MKKLVVSICVLAFCAISMQAQQKQGVKLEGSLGIPTGDLSSGLVFGLGADLSYLFDFSDSFQAGITSGYHNFFAKTDRSSPLTLSGKGQDFHFVPMAASARYYVLEEFFVGTDLGYSFVLIDEVDGGFHYKPKVGYSFGLISTTLSYSGIVLEEQSFNSINLGFEVAF
tara:strand:+ start:1442 stop:1948 length:507 start_codon:yes stop_codon:yes gene_type:complete